MKNIVFKILKKKFSIYASKDFDGQAILNYTKKQQNKQKVKCIIDNLNWFGGLNEAKLYKTNKNHIYQWKIKDETKLIKINKKNENLFNFIFMNTKKKLNTTINIKNEKLKKIKKMIKKENIQCPYFELNNHEKAYFEFKFVFGFMSLNEQFEFLKLCKYLIENKYIDIKRRDGNSIINKINLKIKYYQINPFKDRFIKRINRLSFYIFDKNVCYNLCKLLPNSLGIDGIYIPDAKNFWHIKLQLYPRSILEYIIFNPHKKLIYKKMII